MGREKKNGGSLNPFFVRSSFQTQSGPIAVACPRCRLNPFFVRSSFQTTIAESSKSTSEVLIPSSSGLHFKRAWSHSQISLRSVLIPSSSGLHFKRERLINIGRREDRLNPFFVRSSFQTRSFFGPLLSRRGVLIPSSSGLHFKLAIFIRNACAWSLNPFFVRSSFQTAPCTHQRGPNRRVLIPSSSGLHFKRWGSGSRPFMPRRLNPFFVRSSFQTPVE